MFASRFPLELGSPTDAIAAGETRLMLLSQALNRYQQCLKRESLAPGGGGMSEMGDGEVVGAGEVWTTEAGTVFVQPSYLGSMCETLQVACSLRFRQMRILYPEDGGIDLRGLFDFLLLRAPLRVVIEVDGHLRNDAESRLTEIEWEYRIPNFPRVPTNAGWVQRLAGAPGTQLDPRIASEILDDARFLLRYEAERDPERFRCVLHRLRHLDDSELCRKVLETHRAFYEQGEFETEKTYPRQGDGERVAGYLDQLYQWAQTSGWMSARKRASVRGVPSPWRPTPTHLETLEGPPPRPRPTPSAPVGPLIYSDCLNEADKPRLDGLLGGASRFFDYFLSNANSGQLSGLAAVACAPDLFGVPGVTALLRACGSSEQTSRRLARQWVEDDGNTQQKLDAYLQLREDQAGQIPDIRIVGVDSASAALHAFLTDQAALPPTSPDAIQAWVAGHLNLALEHRLGLRIHRMEPSWSRLLGPLLGARAWSARFTTGKADGEAGSSRFASGIIAVQEIPGSQVLALTEQMVVMHDSGNRQVTVWRPDRPSVRTFETHIPWYRGLAYSVGGNLLLAAEAGDGGSHESVLRITGLPIELNPRTVLFPGVAEKMSFCPEEKWLAAWGRQGWCILKTGDWKTFCFRSRDAATQLGFDPQGRFVAVSHDQGVSLYAQESWIKLARWDGFSAEEMVWFRDHLIIKSPSEVASLKLPSFELVGRQKLSNVSLQSSWLMGSHQTQQKRYDYPTLRLGQTYPLAGDRSWLTQDGKVLLIARGRDHRSNLTAFCSESHKQLATSQEVATDISRLRLAPAERFAVTPGFVFSFAARR